MKINWNKTWNMWIKYRDWHISIQKIFPEKFLLGEEPLDLFPFCIFFFAGGWGVFPSMSNSTSFLQSYIFFPYHFSLLILFLFFTLTVRDEILSVFPLLLFLLFLFSLGVHLLVKKFLKQLRKSKLFSALQY